MPEAQKATLYALAGNSENFTGAMARNILIEVDEYGYDEPVILPEAGLKSGNIVFDLPDVETFTPECVTVYPNPAKGYFIVRYELDNDYADAIIQLTDISGRTVKRYKTGLTMDYLIVQTDNLKPGNYFVKLILNNREVGVQKIVIQ